MPKLSAQIADDLLKGRSKELDGGNPQSIQTRLSRARLALEEAVKEAQEAIAASPATSLFEIKLAEEAAVASAKIEVSPEGELKVLYSVTGQEDLPSEDDTLTSYRTPESLLKELEILLEDSDSGYRGLPLPKLREIAEIAGLNVDKLGRKKIAIYEELVTKLRNQVQQAQDEVTLTNLDDLVSSVEEESEEGLPETRQIRTGDPQPVTIVKL